MELDPPYADRVFSTTRETGGYAVKLYQLFRNALLGLLTITAATVAGADDRASSRQFVYTISNASSGSAVVGYRVGPGGELTPLPGSPFATGGLGQGVGLLVSGDSGLAISSDRRLLFAPNRGTNDISVFRIRGDGTLAGVPGSPFPTGGVTPTSLAVHGNMLFVAHTGLGLFGNCADCDYRGFRIGKSGRLTPIPGAVLPLSATPPSGPFALRFSPDGRFLIGAETVSSKINVFKVARKPSADRPVLTPAPGSPFDSIGKLPLGFSFNPANSTQLFISNLEAVPGTGSVSSYLFAASGQIAPIDRQTPSGQIATCWISVTGDGRWLFATNTDSDSVGSYRVARDGRLTLVGTTPIPRNGVVGSSLIAPTDMAITTDDRYLYMVTRDVPSLVGFAIQPDGQLVPVPGVDPLPLDVPGAVPFGMVAVDLGSPAQEIDYDDE